MQKKKLTYEQAKQKALHYCAYQERSHLEVRNRLYEMGLYAPEVDELITFLITEGFISEERFAKAFAGGKFRVKKWGRIKIVKALEARGLTQNCIRCGLKEIEDEDYLQTLENLLKSKIEALDEHNIFVRRDKASKYGIIRGFEPELVWKKLRDLLPG